MWLMVVGLTLGGLAVLLYASRRWRTASHPDFGWMSQQWLAEHRAGGHTG